MAMQDLRQQIDEINREIAQLFEKRMEISGEIAKQKKENHLPVFDPERERAIINEVTAGVREPFADYTGVLFRTIFDLSRSYQRQCLSTRSSLNALIDRAVSETPVLRPERAVVACQGVEGAYSQHACDKLFKYPTIMYFSQFEDICKAVDSGLCRYGILPVENSTAGSVNEVYDLMSKYKFYITTSMRLFIAHALLAKKGCDPEKINIVYSHEQALRQCKDFIDRNHYRAHVCKNTAAAAKLVAEKDRDDIAAIGSIDCAALYDLQVLSTNIQNTQNNYTRFICISKTPEIYPGAKKTSITFTIANKPGSLYHLLARFAALGLNLTKLESRPIAGTDFEFRFYFDIEESVHSPALRALICELENDSEDFTYLGTYTEE